MSPPRTSNDLDFDCQSAYESAQNKPRHQPFIFAPRFQRQITMITRYSSFVKGVEPTCFRFAMQSPQVRGRPPVRDMRLFAIKSRGHSPNREGKRRYNIKRSRARASLNRLCSDRSPSLPRMNPATPGASAHPDNPKAVPASCSRNRSKRFEIVMLITPSARRNTVLLATSKFLPHAPCAL